MEQPPYIIFSFACLLLFFKEIEPVSSFGDGEYAGEAERRISGKSLSKEKNKCGKEKNLFQALAFYAVSCNIWEEILAAAGQRVLLRTVPLIKDKSMENETTGPVCLECGDRIVYGRSDRKFCCDACKNRFHNRRSSSSRHYRQKIHSALERNYFILDSLRRTSLRNIPMSDMENMGFSREYFTSYSRQSSRETFMCYDIEYSVMKDAVTSIVKVSLVDETAEE